MIVINTTQQGEDWVQILPLHYEAGRYTEPLYIAVNGVEYSIPRGVEGLYVPPAVKEALENGFNLDGIVEPTDFDPGVPIVPSGTLEITENGDYDVSDKATASVNVSEPQLNDVMFYDYDGSVLYSYTADEFLALTEMPANPSHEGLTAQGWNWDFDDAQDYVETYGILDVGQMYITNDGATRFYISLSNKFASKLFIVNYAQTVSGGVTFDWGDGSATETITGTGSKAASHLYADYGDYVVTMTPSDSCSISFGRIFQDDFGFSNSLVKLELGKNITGFNQSFYGCGALETITIPDYAMTLTGTVWSGNCSLKHITIPSHITATPNGAFSSCFSIKSVSLPGTFTSLMGGFGGACMMKRFVIPGNVDEIGSGVVQSTNIERLVFPASVTTIGNQMFYGLHLIAEADFSHATDVPTLGSYAFSDNPKYMKIKVPSALLDSWKAASNWSSMASKIVGV